MRVLRFAACSILGLTMTWVLFGCQSADYDRDISGQNEESISPGRRAYPDALPQPAEPQPAPENPRDRFNPQQNPGMWHGDERDDPGRVFWQPV